MSNSGQMLSRFGHASVMPMHLHHRVTELGNVLLEVGGEDLLELLTGLRFQQVSFPRR